MARSSERQFDEFLERTACVIGRPRTLVAFVSVDIAWIALNLALGDHAFDPRPFPLLGRLSACLACLLIMLAWANGRRLSRKLQAHRARVRKMLEVSDDEVRARLRMAHARVQAELPSPREGRAALH